MEFGIHWELSNQSQWADAILNRVVTVGIMEKGSSGQRLTGGKKATQTSGGKVSQAEGTGSAKALSRKVLACVRVARRPARLETQKWREEWEEEKSERCQVGRESGASRDEASL